MKTLLIPNLNNKLSCKYFSHITFSPDKKIPESELKKKYVIEDPLKSINSFEVELITFGRLPLAYISELDTFVSSGVGREKFILDFKADHPEATKETEIAIYVYKRC